MRARGAGEGLYGVGCPRESGTRGGGVPGEGDVPEEGMWGEKRASQGEGLLEEGVVPGEGNVPEEGLSRERGVPRERVHVRVI